MNSNTRFTADEVRLIQCLFACDSIFRGAADLSSNESVKNHMLTQAGKAAEASAQVVGMLSRKYKLAATVIAAQLSDVIDRSVLEAKEHLDIVLARLFTGLDPMVNCTFDRAMLILATILDMHQLQARKNSRIILATT